MYLVFLDVFANVSRKLAGVVQKRMLQIFLLFISCLDMCALFFVFVDAVVMFSLIS